MLGCYRGFISFLLEGVYLNFFHFNGILFYGFFMVPVGFDIPQLMIGCIRLNE